MTTSCFVAFSNCGARSCSTALKPFEHNTVIWSALATLAEAASTHSMIAAAIHDRVRNPRVVIVTSPLCPRACDSMSLAKDKP
jgi:hypothetical protein